MVIEWQRKSVEIRWSDDGKWFYPEGTTVKHPFWLSSTMYDHRPYSGLFDGIVAINQPDGGNYYRKFIPLSYNRVRGILLHRERVCLDDARIRDYTLVSNLLDQTL